MKVSEFIERLKALQTTCGDLEVVVGTAEEGFYESAAVEQELMEPKRNYEPSLLKYASYWAEPEEGDHPESVIKVY